MAESLREAAKRFPLKNAIFHTDRGSQYTSHLFRRTISELGLRQSMNSAAGRCRDNAHCESMWARFKTELIYGRIDTKKMPVSELKTLAWRYFMGYRNNRRVCMKNGGLPPMVWRRQFHENRSAAEPLAA